MPKKTVEKAKSAGAPKGPVVVVNIMHDGTVCQDLGTYLCGKELPPDAVRLLSDFVQDGMRKLREEAAT